MAMLRDDKIFEEGPARPRPPKAWQVSLMADPSASPRMSLIATNILCDMLRMAHGAAEERVRIACAYRKASLMLTSCEVAETKADDAHERLRRGAEIERGDLGMSFVAEPVKTYA